MRARSPSRETPLGSARRLRAHTLAAKGQVAEAEAPALAALAAAREGQSPMQLWKALAVLGEIERGLGRAGAASRFEEALEVIEWLAARAGDDALAATLRASAAVQSLRAGTRA